MYGSKAQRQALGLNKSAICNESPNSDLQPERLRRERWAGVVVGGCPHPLENQAKRIGGLLKTLLYSSNCEILVWSQETVVQIQQ